MADARFTKYGQRTNWHKPAPSYDSPRIYGWDRVGVDPQTGYDVFQLGSAVTRAMTPEERAQTGNDCYVTIGNDCYACSGGWKDITAWVRKEQGLPEPEPFFMPHHIIPAAAWSKGER